MTTNFWHMYVRARVQWFVEPCTLLIENLTIFLINNVCNESLQNLLEILKTFQTILNILKKKQGFPVKTNKM